jgi:hypothetical protein
VASLCSAMSFMSGCTLWEQCKVRSVPPTLRSARISARPPCPPPAHAPAARALPCQQAGQASGDFCTPASLAANLCVDMPRVGWPPALGRPQLAGCAACDAALPCAHTPDGSPSPAPPAQRR